MKGKHISRIRVYGPDFFSDRQLSSDKLMDLQCRVLDALESMNHPQAESAYDDPATHDYATASQRKAWLATYGPLTDVVID